MLLAKLPRAATASGGGKMRTGLPRASAPWWDIHAGKSSLQHWGWCQHWLCPPSPSWGQAVRTWESSTSCGGGFCLLTQVMPACFHAGECCKKLFGSTSDFGILDLLVAGSSRLSSACMRKVFWGFVPNLLPATKCWWRVGWNHNQSFKPAPSPGLGHPKGPGIHKWTGLNLCAAGPCRTSSKQVTHSLLLSWSNGAHTIGATRAFHWLRVQGWGFHLPEYQGVDAFCM